MRITAGGLLLLALRFVPRMWSSENERRGLKSCTSFGYWALSAADLVSLVALLLLLAIPIYLVYVSLVHRFTPNLLWLLLLPFGTAFTGSLVMIFAWSLARAKHFRYDYTSDTARWFHGGIEVSYPAGRNSQL